MKKKRDMYNMGGISAHKSVGDLDLSLSASGTEDYQRAGASATYRGKGFKVRGEASTDKFGNRSHSIKATKNINDDLSFGFEKRKGYVGVTVEKKL
jgi:hypothetical protein